MLKYGDLLNINNGTSKTLNPRTLVYNNNITIQSSNDNNTTTTSTTQSSGNFNSAIITDLEVNTISLIPNTLVTNIVIYSPIAFSVLKTDYELNNFSLYPIYFSQNMKIENKNFLLNTENFTIKDNVIMLNSENLNNYISNFQTDNLISGYIFPITDQNTFTGYYSGVLYIPNSKLVKISENSTFYQWTNDKYNYFTNQNKGFYKFKYLPQNLNFSGYSNNMDSNYYDLIDNNQNLANIMANAIGLYDGEIIGMNNTNIIFKLSDGETLYDTLNITKTDINILNNLALKFIDSFYIKDTNDNNYISI